MSWPMLNQVAQPDIPGVEPSTPASITMLLDRFHAHLDPSSTALTAQFLSLLPQPDQLASADSLGMHKSTAASLNPQPHASKDTTGMVRSAHSSAHPPSCKAVFQDTIGMANLASSSQDPLPHQAAQVAISGVPLPSPVSWSMPLQLLEPHTHANKVIIGTATHAVSSVSHQFPTASPTTTGMVRPVCGELHHQLPVFQDGIGMDRHALEHLSASHAHQATTGTDNNVPSVEILLRPASPVTSGTASSVSTMLVQAAANLDGFGTVSCASSMVLQ